MGVSQLRWKAMDSLSMFLLVDKRSVFFLSVKTMDDVTWNCDNNPCQNGATCKPGRAQCVCRLGFVGKYCESKLM